MIQAAVTAFFAIIVFVTGQFVVKFIIEPVHEQSKVIGQIAYALFFYADLYRNNSGRGEERDKRVEAGEQFRQLASRLVEKTVAIPWYRLWTILNLKPLEESITLAARNLIGLSNVVVEDDQREGEARRNQIIKLLRITLPLH